MSLKHHIFILHYYTLYVNSEDSWQCVYFWFVLKTNCWRPRLRVWTQT